VDSEGGCADAFCTQVNMMRRTETLSLVLA